ncbi:low molecular weight phosphotyrosine protein phosphatase [Alphaproteobacteria bacterium KMM 3653]|uniref:protein-tyrosine-phosphatase n=1 Tax=Harenicola maris TaxID=2841044 RepID=A0AAP2G9U4_9RHOB|nr:low molecular weight phosphotyrosine protein phosphatase [Harenicola maris]
MVQSVLFVCLGNICRSPTAHGVMLALAERAGLPLRIDSAGTGAWHIGNPPDRRMQAAARAQGYDLSGLRARQFCEQDFADFDLILGMDRSNIANMERLRPAGNDTPLRLFLPYGGGAIEEVPDPYYEGGFDGVVTMIEEAAKGLLDQLQ